ncbi:MAG: hypothetical protein PF694_06160, partial [Bacteroidetes bacterium]|nr:hypothetical protein [Bacteroidota bacterium]
VFLEGVDFPSIDKKETAIFIFEFINFIRHRSKNNSIVEFSKFEDIQDFLKKQWAALFQRLLFEQKTRKEEIRRFDFLTTQLTDIKTTLLTTITNADLKETARGAIKYRKLIDFVSAIAVHKNPIELLLADTSVEKILAECEISEIVQSDGVRRPSRYVYYIRKDRTFIQSRFNYNLGDLDAEFNDFKQLKADSKQAIINAIRENEDRILRMFRYYEEDFDVYMSEKNSENNED